VDSCRVSSAGLYSEKEFGGPIRSDVHGVDVFDTCALHCEPVLTDETLPIGNRFGDFSQVLPIPSHVG
jgi:hypothetical protein